MKVIFVVSLLVLAVAVIQAKAQSVKPPLNIENTVSLANATKEEGKAKSYDPCNYDPTAHYYCAVACFNVGYSKGGLCLGYNCYCYV